MLKPKIQAVRRQAMGEIATVSTVCNAMHNWGSDEVFSRMLIRVRGGFCHKGLPECPSMSNLFQTGAHAACISIQAASLF